MSSNDRRISIPCDVGNMDIDPPHCPEIRRLFQVLPAEIIVEIVEHAATVNEQNYTPEPAIGVSLSKLCTLTNICRRWRYILRSTPSLWTDINLSHPPNLLESALQYSQQAQIFVKLRIRAKQKVQETRVVHKILSEMHRITSLSIHSEDVNAFSHFQSYFDREATVLQYFYIFSGNFSTSTGRPIIFSQSLFLGRAPLLRVASFVRTVAPWHSQVFQNLSRLTLGSIHRDYQIRFSHLMAILRNSPNIEHLSLHMSGPRDFPSVADLEFNIQLPRLHSVFLGLIRPSCKPLLTSISMPNIKELSICHDASGGIPEIRDLIPDRFTPPTVERLEVFVAINRFRMEFRSGLVRPQTVLEFSCRLRSRLIAELTASFFRHWNFSHITHFTYTSICRYWESACLCDALLAMQNLESLVLYCFPPRLPVNVELTPGEKALRTLQTAQGRVEVGLLVMPKLHTLIFREMKFIDREELQPGTLQKLSDFLLHRVNLGSVLRKLCLDQCGITHVDGVSLLGGLAESLEVVP